MLQTELASMVPAKSLCARMRLVVNLQHVLHRQLRVALRSGKTFVTEHLLNRPQVRALLEHVRAESVPQGVRMHVR
jgi:hypothetical protein